MFGAGFGVHINKIYGNSYGTYDDSFAGTTINNNYWLVNNPDSTNFIIEQNEKLRFRRVTDTNIPTQANYIEGKFYFSNLSFAATLKKETTFTDLNFSFGLRNLTANHYFQIISISGALTIRVFLNGSLPYVVNTGVTFGTGRRLKVAYHNNVVYFYYWNVNQWTLLGSYNHVSAVDFVPYLSCSSPSTAAPGDIFTMANAVVTDTEYTGSLPESSDYDTSFRSAIHYGFDQLYNIPSKTKRMAESQLYTDMKSIGLWDASPALYIHRTDGDSDFACINRKAPGTRNALKVNSPGYTRRGGFTGNGSSSYLNYQFIPSTHGGSLFTLNDAGVVAYTPTSTAQNTNLFGFYQGDGGSNGNFHIFPRQPGDFFAARTNTDNASIQSASSSDASGLWILKKISSGNVTITKNNITLFSGAVQNAAGVGSITMVGLARNLQGTIGTFFNGRLDCFIPFKATSVSDTDINTIWNNYITALG